MHHVDISNTKPKVSEHKMYSRAQARDGHLFVEKDGRSIRKEGTGRVLVANVVSGEGRRRAVSRDPRIEPDVHLYMTCMTPKSYGRTYVDSLVASATGPSSGFQSVC